MDILGYLYAIAITVGGIAGYINKGINRITYSLFIFCEGVVQ
jgi:hypothetical protein